MALDILKEISVEMKKKAEEGTGTLLNKNRHCTKTCGIDKIFKQRRSENIKRPLNSKRFHPDKSYNNSFNINGRDPNPKRNLVKELRIPP